MGYFECALSYHKNAGRQKQAKRLLPAACRIPGLVGDWASKWSSNRVAVAAGLSANLAFQLCLFHCLEEVPLDPPQATVWLREIFAKTAGCPPVVLIGAHSLKATVLSWMSKCNCAESLRRLAGYHVDPGSKSALEYSRDGQSPVLYEIEGSILIIRAGLFRPDESRAKRWKNKNCRSLKDCIAFLHGEDVTSVHLTLILTFLFRVSVILLCIQTWQQSENTSGEDREAEVSAAIVGALVTQGLHV